MSKEFWKATGIRALRTVCQTAVATIGTAMVITDVNWHVVLSASILSGLLSVLTSIATGLPEVEYKQNIDMNIPEPDGSYSDGYLTEEEKAAIRAEMGGDEDV